ncbi:MAG: hypothetical protein WCS33_00170 [Candidatus Caldatribacteriota bacterium]|jgi:hypothetical protein
MKRVFKYPLVMMDRNTIVLPKGSKILSVESQKDDIVVYAIVDDSVSTEVEEHVFLIRGTGHPADDVDGYDFLNTVKLYGDTLIFHIFYARGD